MMEDVDAADEAFVAIIGDHLRERRMEAAVGDLANESNRRFLYEHGLDLVPLVGECLTADGEEHPGHFPLQSDVARRCQEAFQLLAERGNPKEVLLELLGQLETGVPSPVQFHVLLPPIRTALLRTPVAKRDATLRWVLAALVDGVRSLPPPPPHAWVVEADELLPPPPPAGFLDPDVETVSGATDELLLFCRPLVEEVSLFGPEAEEPVGDRRHLLAEFVLSLLGEPFCFLDLGAPDGCVKTFQRLIAEHLIVDLCKLESDFYRFYSLIRDEQLVVGAESNERAEEESDKSAASTKVTPLALATFAYLVHAERVCAEHVPAVYSHRHALRANVPLATLLLRHVHPGAVDKGLRLAGQLLEMTALLSLGADLLDLAGHLGMALALADVAVYCRAQRLRHAAVDTLGRYVERFDMDGRCQLLYRMLHSCEHSGVQALLIQLFKNNLRLALDGESPPAAAYVGRSLARVLTTVLRLEDGVRTDLVDRCERTLAALNLLRYLLIRDPETRNVSGVWSLLPTLRENYLQPLQTALNLSRMHHTLELKRLQEGLSTPQEGILTVNGMTAPMLVAAEELTVVNSSLTAFELIQSVLCRVHELLGYKPEAAAPKTSSEAAPVECTLLTSLSEAVDAASSDAVDAAVPATPMEVGSENSTSDHPASVTSPETSGDEMCTVDPADSITPPEAAPDE